MEDIEGYFKSLKEEVERALKVANKARAKGYDPEDKVEIKIANSLGERVEGLLNIKGLNEILKSLEKQGLSREEMAFEITKRIAKGELLPSKSKEEAVEKAIRVGVAILTEGVLVAPTEGISKVKIKKGSEGEYLSIYYSGPIRSAGGTVAALSVVLGDIARRELGLSRYKATKQEIARIIEEVNLYDARAARLQYKPEEEELTKIVENIPVAVEGEPTEEIEVSVNRDLPRIETNRVRGGVALVLCEGIAQKAQKLLKYVKALNLSDWKWLEDIVEKKLKAKGKDESQEEEIKIKPNYGFLDGLVAGRPIFAYPSKLGGFRIRYGKARTNGLMAKGIHPATMIVLDNFLANGTHIKVERPGKGAVVSSVDSILAPIVKLKDGSVVRIKDVEHAKQIKDEIKEIIYLGDLLTTYGDFLKSNTPLLPSPYVEEWWELEVKDKLSKEEIKKASQDVEFAFEIAKQKGLPLHPGFTLFWNALSKEELVSLYLAIKEEMKKEHNKDKEELLLKHSKEVKKALEKLGVEHSIEKQKEELIRIKRPYSIILKKSLLKEHLSKEELEREKERCKDALCLINKLAGIEIKDTLGSFIGARMGRPEKAKERRMEASPNVLFPTGDAKIRSLTKLYNNAKIGKKRAIIEIEVATFRCTKCGKLTFYNRCHLCNGKAKQIRKCVVCGRETTLEKHCGKETKAFSKLKVDLTYLYEKAKKKVGNAINEVKGVKGMTSKEKIPERLEKGFLRAKHNIYVFRDGTSRFDASDVPLTHVILKEIGLSVKRAKELGYTKDWQGNPLENEEQMIAIYPQDILLSQRAANYLIRVANFIDDLLINLYGMEPYYNIKKKEDLIGHLVIALAPHISTGVVGRIIGFTDANVFYAHPYMHAAKRRNCDGDEDSIMLLLDAFINFSKHYLSESRGGTMDSCLVLTLTINPKEVDDEVHSIEVERYSLSFYQSTLEYKNPGEVKIKTVKDKIEENKLYFPFLLTHPSSSIHEGNNTTRYKELNSIPEKVEAEIELMRKIRAVELKDSIERLILSHFIPDIYGNLRRFSRQKFRCVNCQAKYRRVPLKGVCLRCGGNLTLTIHKGGIEKYLNTTIELAKRYDLSLYLIQRLNLVKKEIESLFEDEKNKQMGLFDYL